MSHRVSGLASIKQINCYNCWKRKFTAKFIQILPNNVHLSKVSTLLFGERVTWIANLMSSQTLESSNTEARPNLITGKKIKDHN